MSRQMVIERISREADKLAIQYNKTKDPGIRDQWYKLIRTVSQVSPVSEEARLSSRKKI
jgi:hypothetical protein